MASLLKCAHCAHLTLPLIQLSRWETRDRTFHMEKERDVITYLKGWRCDYLSQRLWKLAFITLNSGFHDTKE